LLLAVLFLGTVGCQGTSSDSDGSTDDSDSISSYSDDEDAQEEDVSSPDHIIGTGSADSCNVDDFIDAVALGGTIVFDCGDEPLTLTMSSTAKIYNDQDPDVIIDGGGLITLDGNDQQRIIYMNTCDEDLVWTTSYCNDQDHPRLTLQNITLVNGNSTSDTEYTGGGAVWVRGGRFKVINSNFYRNQAIDSGPDTGGGAIRVFDQYDDQPVYIVNSIFGGSEDNGNTASNGGALSSIGVSWTIIDSYFSHNQALGEGGNPAEDGTEGGGSGGAIYNDGNTMTLNIINSTIEENEVNSYGSGIFFVTNDLTGNIYIEDSTISNNIGGSWYSVYPNISMHSDTDIEVVNSTISE
jgi:membrane-bound inhibitor of C-type lysozyme